MAETTWERDRRRQVEDLARENHRLRAEVVELRRRAEVARQICLDWWGDGWPRRILGALDGDPHELGRQGDHVLVGGVTS